MQPKITVKEYTEALTENRLLGLVCQDCKTITAPPRMACRRCSGINLETIELSGKGKIVTFTAVHVPPESRQGQPPYIIVMVELDEGPWIMANLSGVDPDTACMKLIGKRVTMVTPQSSPERRPEGGLAPLFILEG